MNLLIPTEPGSLPFGISAGLLFDACNTFFCRIRTGKPRQQFLIADGHCSGRTASAGFVFCADFVLANDVQERVSVDFSLTDASGAVLFSYQGEVPVLRAHRTDVSWGYDPGDIDQPGGVGIDPGFETEIEIKI